MKILIKDLFNKFGYELKRKKIAVNSVNVRKAEGYPDWLKKAQEAGMDVNDYINSKMSTPKLTLEKFVLPCFKEITNPVFCEIGIGTGRWSRDIATELKKNKDWKLYLIDHSPWIINFLENYFEKEKNIIPVLNDGLTLPIEESESVDIIFSNGTFIEFDLQTICSYSHEFKRVLKKNRHVIFNYIDIDSSVGYEHMKKQAGIINSCFTYHSASTIDRIFSEDGFDLILREVLGNSTYVIFRKR